MTTAAPQVGILAAQIIALGDPAIAGRLDDFKVELASGVEKLARVLEERLQAEKF
jgi:phosphoribosylcarboxyaminoimidazole (NCAIR) mutase